MFSKFAEEREANPDEVNPEITFFAECIVDKLNRSKKFTSKSTTPFLDDSRYSKHILLLLLLLLPPLLPLLLSPLFLILSCVLVLIFRILSSLLLLLHSPPPQSQSQLPPQSQVLGE
jgi:hypothetical protein